MTDRPRTFATTVDLAVWVGVDGVDRGPVSLPVLMGDPGGVVIAPPVRGGQVILPPRDLAYDVLVPAAAVRAYDPRISDHEVRVPVGVDHVAGRKRIAIDRATGDRTTYYVAADVDVDVASAAELVGEIAAVVGMASSAPPPSVADQKRAGRRPTATWERAINEARRLWDRTDVAPQAKEVAAAMDVDASTYRRALLKHVPPWHHDDLIDFLDRERA